MPADSVLQFSLLSGLDTRTDQHSKQLGALAQAVNCVFDKTGAVRKRHGNVAQGIAALAWQSGAPTVEAPIGGPTLPVNPLGYLTRVGEQSIAAGTRLYTYSPGLAGHISKDDFPECVGTRRPLSSAQATPYAGNGAQGYFNPDMAVSSDGLTCVVWQSALAGGLISVTVYDKAQGGGRGPVVYGPVTVTSPSSAVNNNPRVVAVGTAFVIVWTSTDGNTASHIYATTLNHTSAGWTALTTGTLLSSYGPVTIPIVFDVVSDGVDFYVSAAASTFSVITRSFAPDTTNAGVYTPINSRTTAVANSTTGEISAIAMALNGGNLWTFWAETVSPASVLCVSVLVSSTFGVVIVQPVASDIIGPSAVGVVISYLAATPSAGSGVYVVGWNSYALANRGPLPELVSVTGTATIPAGYTSTGFPGPDGQLVPVARPVLVGSKLYVMCWLSSALQGSWFWVDLNVEATTTLQRGREGPRVVCVLAPRLAGNFARSDGSLSSCPPRSGVYVTPIGVTLGGAGRTGPSSPGQYSLWEASLNYAHPNLAIGSTLGRQAIAQSSIYDGALVSELGFLTYPEGYTGAPQSAGSMTAGSTYLYALVWEWLTNAGELVQSTTQASATSQTLSVTLSGSQHGVVLTTSALSGGPWLSTSKADYEQQFATPPTLAIYRSQAGGTTLTRVAGLGNASSSPTGQLFYATTYTDTASDTSIASNVGLYFTPGAPGGVLDNVCPPSFSHTITALGAVWGIGDDLRTIWVSKPYVEGFQPGFNEDLTTTIEDGGDLVALGYLNQNVIAFTTQRLYLTYGPNPGATGTAAPMYQFTPSQTDVGCTDPRSLVTIPDGLVFLSQKGFCCLGQDCSVNYLDAPEDILAAYPNITSAVLVPEHQEARFELNNGAGAGVTLVLNYWAPTAAYKYKWSTFQKYDAGGAVASCVAVGGYVGGYRWAAASGYPYVEDTTGATYMDGGSSSANWVTMLVQSGWIEANGIVGYQRGKRVGLMGDWYTSHNLTFSVATDFQSSTSNDAPTGQSVTFNSDIVEGGPLDRYRIHVKNQKHQALQITVQDAYPTGAQAVVRIRPRVVPRGSGAPDESQGRLRQADCGSDGSVSA